MIFVQTEKEKLCCLTQARTHKPKYFTGFKERCFAPPLLSQGCFSPLLFGTNSAIVWLRQQAACQQVQHTQERAAGQTSWSAGTPEGKISHHSMLTHWSWDLILYSGHMGGRAASALLLLVSVSQAATALIKKKKSCSWTFWGPHYLSQVGLHSFPVGMWDLLPLFYNETSSNKKASTFPEAIYMNCKASSSGYKVPIMR